MSTLAIMKQRIADELSRSDLATQTSYAISDAIAKWQRLRFYFNETSHEGYEFDTITNQETYSGLDDPNLPWFYDVDDVFVVVGVNKYRVKRIDPTLYRINQMPYFRGQPYNYMWLGQSFSFSPIPNTVYTMKVVGHYKITEPLTDSEAGNPWMTDAERLIRQTAKRILYQDILLDTEAASACMAAETEAFESLKAASATMTANRQIAPMEF